MDERAITRNDINNNTINFVRQEESRSWGATIEIAGLPKRVDFRALEKMLLAGNKTSFKLISTAAGVAYMRGSEHISERDADTAIKMEERGIERLLPEPEEGRW